MIKIDGMTKIKFTGIRLPTVAEVARGAEIAFDYTETRGSHTIKTTILACTCYESWEQWGASTEVLGANVDIVEKWRHNGFDEFPAVKPRRRARG